MTRNTALKNRTLTESSFVRETFCRMNGLMASRLERNQRWLYETETKNITGPLHSYKINRSGAVP